MNEKDIQNAMIEVAKKNRFPQKKTRCLVCWGRGGRGYGINFIECSWCNGKGWVKRWDIRLKPIFNEHWSDYYE